MMHQRIFILVIFVAISLSACSQNELFDDTISTIEVQDKEIGEMKEIIKDEAFINNLTTELENANTASIDNLDIPGPDYKVIFWDEDSNVLELGYYLEEQNFSGLSGRFIDMDKGVHYGVETELPIRK